MKLQASSGRLAALIIVCSASPTLLVGSAHAQVGESLLLPPVIPPGFDRGRNQSVTELPQKGFNPVGIPVGSFIVIPSLRSEVGVTSNTYYSTDPIASAFLSNTPTAQLISQWKRHQLTISGTGTFREFIGQSRRNEATWQAGFSGRVDLGRFTTVTVEENSSLANENQFSGETIPTIAALSRYRRDYFSVRTVNQVGRLRLTAAIDDARFRYQPLPLLTGNSITQRYRNRNIMRVTGQVEYARTPDFAFFVQASFADQHYDIPLSNTSPNFDSISYRILGGFNFDDPGFARGSVGIGYTYQAFTASIYKPESGVSVVGRVDIFPARLTTVSITAQRSLETTNVSASGAYWNNIVSMRVDREVWRRIIVNLNADYSKQSYQQVRSEFYSYQLSIGARYLSSRKIVVDANVTYGSRTGSTTVFGNKFNEARSLIGLTYRI